STDLQAQVNSFNGTVSDLQEKINTISDTVSNQDNLDELYTIIKIDTNSRDYEQHKANNDNNVLYDFKSKKWSNSLFESYYLAVDSQKNF
ncbi:MAG: hypothetical protein PUD28_00180, partial [Lactobacillus sp.]|nr:hypothetical protein [Lactobacillus sp.]